MPLYKMQEWTERHNLHLLYDIDPQSFEDRRIAHTLDHLAGATEKVHIELVNRIIELYHLPVRAVLWDLTHLSFEGAY